MEGNRNAVHRNAQVKRQNEGARLTKIESLSPAIHDCLPFLRKVCGEVPDDLNSERESRQSGSTRGQSHSRSHPVDSGTQARHKGASKTFQPQAWGLTSITAIARDSLQFEKRGQLFIRAYNEALSIVAMRVNNEDCSPVGGLCRIRLPFGGMGGVGLTFSSQYVRLNSHAFGTPARGTETTRYGDT